MHHHALTEMVFPAKLTHCKLASPSKPAISVILLPWRLRVTRLVAERRASILTILLLHADNCTTKLYNKSPSLHMEVF